MHQWDFASVLDNSDALLTGALGTLHIFAICLVAGLSLGLVVGLGRYSQRRLFSWPATAFVEFFRNTPVLVQIIWFYFALPILMPFSISPLAAASLGISLNSAAFSAEIYRGGIQSIDRGQWDGARALGMSFLQAMRRIILPQAGRIAVPPLSNTFISLVKDTSLAAAITVPELFRAGQRIVATTYEPLILYVQVALIYLVVSSVLSTLQARLEKRLSRYGGYIEAAS